MLPIITIGIYGLAMVAAIAIIVGVWYCRRTKIEQPEDVEETTESDFSEVMELRSHARADVDTAIAAYNFIDELDLNGPEVLRFGLKRRLTNAKKNCLILLCESVDGLTTEPARDEGEEKPWYDL